VQELETSIATAIKPARSTLMCEDFACCARDVTDALSKCVSPKQILNMDESGVTAGPFKGKKRKVVPLTSCQTAPRFQDARDVTHVSVVAIVLLGLNSRRPLFCRSLTWRSRLWNCAKCKMNSITFGPREAP
jgi:hypothetical protein